MENIMNEIENVSHEDIAAVLMGWVKGAIELPGEPGRYDVWRNANGHTYPGKYPFYDASTREDARVKAREHGYFIDVCTRTPAAGGLCTSVYNVDGLPLYQSGPRDTYAAAEIAALQFVTWSIFGGNKPAKT